MLDRAHRLTNSSGFSRIVRGGRRAGSRSLVVHYGSLEGRTGEPRLGLVVGRQVGPAVVRNRVKRQLRHLARTRLTQLPPGTGVVIRALPASATCDSTRLAEDLDGCLSRLTGARVR